MFQTELFIFYFKFLDWRMYLFQDHNYFGEVSFEVGPCCIALRCTGFSLRPKRLYWSREGRHTCSFYNLQGSEWNRWEYTKIVIIHSWTGIISVGAWGYNSSAGLNSEVWKNADGWPWLRVLSDHSNIGVWQRFFLWQKITMRKFLIKNLFELFSGSKRDKCKHSNFFTFPFF